MSPKRKAEFESLCCRWVGRALLLARQHIALCLQIPYSWRALAHRMAVEILLISRFTQLLQNPDNIARGTAVAPTLTYLIVLLD